MRKGYRGSHSTVQRYMRRRGEKMARERERRDSQSYLQLGWIAGECQEDFGEAEFRVRSVVARGRHPAVTFPHPDVGPARIFYGETSGCACQGTPQRLRFLRRRPPQSGLRQRRRGRRARRGRDYEREPAP